MGIELKKFISNTDYKTPKNILVIGVVHGDEPQGEFLINKYLENKTRKIKNNMFYIPRLNFSDTRKNKNGVDINRNFPTKNWTKEDKNSDYFGGEEPNSEIETKFVVNLMNKINFDAIITLHAPYRIVNYDGPAEYLANKISEILEYPAESDIGYPTPGSFGTYSGVERKIPTITIECDEEADLNELYIKFEKFFIFLENEY